MCGFAAVTLQKKKTKICEPSVQLVLCAVKRIIALHHTVDYTFYSTGLSELSGII